MNKLITAIFICFALVGCQQLKQKNYQIAPSNSLLELHNSYRPRSSALQISNQLTYESQKWAERMANRDEMKHSDLSMIPFNYKGENIASGQLSEYEVMESWRNSEGHFRNIKNPSFTHVGFGKAVTHRGTTYWCVMFGG